MPFYVYGKNALTGEVAKRLFSAAPTQEEARREVEGKGIEVSAVVACQLPPARTASAVAASGAPPAPERGSAAAMAMGQFRRELGNATRTTWVTFALIAVNALVFGLMCLSGVSASNPSVAGLMDWGADFGPKSLDGQGWRVLTSMFVHIGFLHVFYNMLALLPAGRSLELLIGSRNFFLIYLISGLAGSLWALYWTPLLASAGASGAVFGVYGALGAVVFMRGGAMPPGLMTSLKHAVIAFIAYNAVYSWRPGISLSAHVGGLVIGFVCGMVVASADPSREADTIPDRAAPLAVFGAIMLAAGFLGLHLRYPGLSKLQDELARFDALDVQYAHLISEAATRYDHKDMSGVEFEQMVNRDVLPGWSALHDELLGYQPVPLGLQYNVTSTAAYMQLRADGWKLFSDALRDGGKDKLDVAGRKMHEANLAVLALFRGTRTRVLPEQKKT